MTLGHTRSIQGSYGNGEADLPRIFGKSNLQVKDVEHYETKPEKAIGNYAKKLKGRELTEVRESLSQKGFRQVNVNTASDELGFSNGTVVFLVTASRDGTVTAVRWKTGR